ncbi:hypothetical protein BJV78DRAFT_1282633 [Lactifluus subvellereus]|nr:hypothetical protein BJV78DRAFT_1282633 [Lactifluus subvellereus]
MPEPRLSCHRAQGVALPVSLPAPHPALTARAAQPQVVIDEVLAGARWVLATCPNLAIVILVPKASVGGPARVTLRATPRPHHTCRTTPSRHRRGACWSTPGPRHMPELRHSYPPIQGKRGWPRLHRSGWHRSPASLRVALPASLAGARRVLATCPNFATLILPSKASVGGLAYIAPVGIARLRHSGWPCPRRSLEHAGQAWVASPTSLRLASLACVAPGGLARVARWSTPGPRHMPELHHSYPPIQGKRGWPRLHRSGWHRSPASLRVALPASLAGARRVLATCPNFATLILPSKASVGGLAYIAPVGIARLRRSGWPCPRRSLEHAGSSPLHMPELHHSRPPVQGKCGWPRPRRSGWPSSTRCLLEHAGSSPLHMPELHHSRPPVQGKCGWPRPRRSGWHRLLASLWVASPASLPMPHPALTTRAGQPQAVIDEVLSGARRVLATCPILVILVLAPKASVGGLTRVTPGGLACVAPRATPRPHHTRHTPSSTRCVPEHAGSSPHARTSSSSSSRLRQALVPCPASLPAPAHPKASCNSGAGDKDEDEDAAVGRARDMFAYAQAWREARVCGLED